MVCDYSGSSPAVVHRLLCVLRSPGCLLAVCAVGYSPRGYKVGGRTVVVFFVGVS